VILEEASAPKQPFDKGSTPTDRFKIGDNPVPSAGEHFGINFALVCERG
jgi:hypothetical protein